MDASVERVRVRVEGKVQGVGYRVAAHKEADRLELTGWVKNLDDGSVEIYAEGLRELVAEMVAWACKGPTSAQVTAAQELERSQGPARCDAFRVTR